MGDERDERDDELRERLIVQRAGVPEVAALAPQIEVAGSERA